MPMATLRGVALALGAAALAACTQPSGDVVSANAAQSAQSVQFGTVIPARNVTVQGGQGAQAAGAIVGGIAGAALGQNVGRGTGQVLATGTHEELSRTCPLYRRLFQSPDATPAAA